MIRLNTALALPTHARLISCCVTKPRPSSVAGKPLPHYAGLLLRSAATQWLGGLITFTAARRQAIGIAWRTGAQLPVKLWSRHTAQLPKHPHACAAATSQGLLLLRHAAGNHRRHAWQRVDLPAEHLVAGHLQHGQLRCPLLPDKRQRCGHLLRVRPGPCSCATRSRPARQTVTYLPGLHKPHKLHPPALLPALRNTLPTTCPNKKDLSNVSHARCNGATGAWRTPYRTTLAAQAAFVCASCLSPPLPGMPANPPTLMPASSIDPPTTSL